MLTTDEHQAEEDAIADILKEMVTEEQLIKELDLEILYYKPTFFYSEQHLAKLLQQKLKAKLDVDSNRVKSWINRFTACNQIQLSSQQLQAVETAALEKVMILTGGPVRERLLLFGLSLLSGRQWVRKLPVQHPLVGQPKGYLR